jgi:hypothetical protein
MPDFLPTCVCAYALQHRACCQDCPAQVQAHLCQAAFCHHGLRRRQQRLTGTAPGRAPPGGEQGKRPQEES